MKPLSPALHDAILPRRKAGGFGRLFLFPAAVYFILFSLLTWPLITRFSAGYFCDAGDGLQNVWNIWWVSTAWRLHLSPYFTPFLHAPSGVSLIGHTLNIFNGLVCIPLLHFLSLIQAHNTIVVFGFVMSGVTAFWLARDFVTSYAAALLAGALFTFSEFHFAHAQGHLQLVSMEWLPLAALTLHRFTQAPTAPRGIAAAAALFLNILCDYYYFLYAGCIGIIFALFAMRERRDARFFTRKENRPALLAFLLCFLFTSGAIALALIWQNHADPLTGSHAARRFSMDLLAPFIPGGHWRFGNLTAFFWRPMKANENETSVYLGWITMLLALYAFLRRREVRQNAATRWAIVALAAWLFALGPVLRVWNHQIPIPLPYMVAEILPIFRVSGMPIRFMVVVALAISVLAAIGWELFLARFNRLPRMGIAILLLAGIAFELLPSPIPFTRPIVPPYVLAMRSLPQNAAIIDTVSDSSHALFYQTIHHKRLAFGYISRVPQSVITQDDHIRALLDHHDYRALRTHFGFACLVLQQPVNDPALHTLYHDAAATIYRIGDAAPPPSSTAPAAASAP